MQLDEKSRRCAAAAQRVIDCLGITPGQFAEMLRWPGWMVTKLLRAELRADDSLIRKIFVAARANYERRGRTVAASVYLDEEEMLSLLENFDPLPPELTPEGL